MCWIRFDHRFRVDKGVVTWVHLGAVQLFIYKSLTLGCECQRKCLFWLLQSQWVNNMTCVTCACVSVCFDMACCLCMHAFCKNMFTHSRCYFFRHKIRLPIGEAIVVDRLFSLHMCFIGPCQRKTVIPPFLPDGTSHIWTVITCTFKVLLQDLHRNL